ncbi:MAG: 30S ribosomal protein S2 [Candidatus Levybacteria bacterium]|nr:30S ribosomal protein S2 [Candidatus Levybacteria bacterium]
MRTVSLEELLEAGCHFGHQVSRQNSKAKDYIFESRDKIHIIDLEKTKEGLEDAGKFIKDVARRNGTLLVLGTKRQAETVLQEERKRMEADEVSGMYFVTKRWIGGTLTNFSEVAKNYKKLKDLTAKLKDPRERTKYTKKELSDWDKSRAKLESFYGGIADMPTVPDAIFIIDTHLEHVAAGESKRAGIPTVGITDTNADPTIITYPVPANDDAVGSLKLIISYVFDAWAEGRTMSAADAATEEKAQKVAADAAEAKSKKEAETPKKEAASNAVKSEKSKDATSNVAKKEVKPAEKKAEAPKKPVASAKTDASGEAKVIAKQGPVKKPAAKKAEKK